MLKQTFQLLGGVAALLAVAAPLHAVEFESLAEVRVGAYENTVTDSGPGSTLAQVTDHGSTIGLQPNNGTEASLWSGRASAQSGSGYLRTFAQMQTLLGGAGGSYDVYGQHRVQGALGNTDFNANFGMGFTAEARAYIRDTLTVSAAGLEGQEGTLQLSVNVAGHVAYSHTATNVLQSDLMQAISASSSVIANTSTGGWMSESFGVQSYFSFFGPEPLALDQPAGGTATFHIPFTFGEAFDLELQLFTIASLGVFGIDIGMFSMLSDFHNTAVVSGVTVLDGSSNPVTASVLGNTALDYSQAFTAPAAPPLPALADVPEPASLALLGLAGLVLLRRRSA